MYGGTILTLAQIKADMLPRAPKKPTFTVRYRIKELGRFDRTGTLVLEAIDELDAKFQVEKAHPGCTFDLVHKHG